MRVKGLMLAAALVGVLGSVNAALGVPVVVQTSKENYFSGGGTTVTCSGEGCTSASFSVGTTTGLTQWHVVTQISRDTAAGTTIFSYTVVNDLLSSAITGFYVRDSGLLGSATTAANWTFSQDATAWHVATTGAGISALGSVNVMTVTVQGLVPLTFASNTGIDQLTGTQSSSVNWLVAAPSAPPITNPEPGTLALLGTGIAAAGVWGRRKIQTLKTQARRSA